MMNLMLGDCLERMAEIESGSVDCVVTSPPYDNLRSYRSGATFDFEGIAIEFRRVLTPGGVLVWVVNDETKDWGETGTSFRQALHFQSIGLTLFDTMIYAKSNPPPCGNPRRYSGVFEFMFVFSKGRPKTANIKTEPCKRSGEIIRGGSHRDHGKDLRSKWGDGRNYNETKRLGNIWYYKVGTLKTGHPAPFPLQLATDHVLSWTDPGDLVLDPFLGSGTTGAACVEIGRDFIGIERDPGYFQIATARIEAARAAHPLFASGT